MHAMVGLGATSHVVISSAPASGTSGSRPADDPGAPLRVMVDVQGGRPLRC
jgi:hypothetical protein